MVVDPGQGRYYTVMMNASIRKILYFLMVTLLINAGGWTFNREAVADVWFDEQRNFAAEIAHTPEAEDSAAQSASHKSAESKVPCNHWCHAIGHFVGLFSSPMRICPSLEAESFPPYSFTPSYSSTEDPYRPPRYFS